MLFDHIFPSNLLFFNNVFIISALNGRVNSAAHGTGKTHLRKQKNAPLVGGFLRNNLSNSKQASIRHSDVRLLMDRHAYLFGLRTVETQCTGTVRIIALSLHNGK